MAILRGNPNEAYEKLLHTAKKARLPYDKEVWLNLSFYLGEQYIEWADDIGAIRRIPRKPNFSNSPRPVANKVMHFVNQEHSMVLQTRPTVDVMAATDDPIDVTNASVASAYLDWLADTQVADFDTEIADAAMWALSTTEGYLKWVWNPRLKRGDIVSCPPLDIYTDPYVKKFHNARYVIHSQFMDVEQVYDIYGVEVKPSDVDRADPTKAALMREMGMAPVLEGTIVNELWLKPNRRYPQGLFVVWSNRDQLVPPQAFPYKHNRLPFTQLGSIPRPGTGHYTSAVSFMRAPQMELNKFHAQMILIREAFANPKWWIPTELDLEQEPDDSPRQILKGQSMGGTIEPKIIQPTLFPANDNGQWISREMMDVVGIHEVSQAQVPGRVEAAKAIELLKESDDGRLAELLRTIKHSISEGFWQQLQLAKQFMGEGQLVQTYSREGLPEVRRFKQEQINPGMKVRVTMGTGLAKSRAARSDQLMTMWQNGIIQDRELMAELLEIPASSITPSNAFDLRLARNENLTLSRDIAVTPNSWDNHELHLREHNNYRKTSEYLELPAKVKSKFEFHCQMHEKLQIQQLGKQLQIQQLAAAVASGAGFQPPGQDQQQGGGDQQQSNFPAAAGAQPQVDPFAERNSPQGQASFQNRTEDRLHHAHV